MALAMAVIAALSMSGVPATKRQSSGLPRLTGSLALLVVASFLAGASSTALWSFPAKLATLTGVYLLWGIRALPDRPATGVSVALLALAVGQTVGASLFGLMMDGLGADYAVAAFAAVALFAGAARAQR